MSSTYVSAELRREVVERAQSICEYCLIHEDDTFFGCHVDHVISEKHGGPTSAENLALACSFCNSRKGSDIASLTKVGALTRLFNPRMDVWSQHFRHTNGIIEPLSEIGEVTISLLQLNSAERILERQELIAIGRYSGNQQQAMDK